MKLKLGGRGCLCRECGEHFTGAEPFDQHRTGQFTGQPPSHGRSCLSPDAMYAKGMRQDDKGRWMQAVKALRAVVGVASEQVDVAT